MMARFLTWLYVLCARCIWRSTTPKRRRTPMRIAFRRPWPGTRRGLKLWMLAVIIGLKGVGYVRGHNSADTDSALRLVTQSIPLTVAGYGIVAICVFAGFCAYCHHGRDQYGYAALVGFSWAWAAVYVATPVLLDGPTFAWQGAITWAGIGAVLLMCAGDPDAVVVESREPRP